MASLRTRVGAPLKDDGKQFMRGGHAYLRPTGSKRYALDIRGKYKPDDSWIEGNDYAVAYHGTSLANATQIIRSGFDITKVKRSNHGKGIYCSPDPKTALAYSTAYERSGKQYKLLIQVRVHSTKVSVVKPDGDLSCGAYWLDSDATAFRPYAICEYAQ